MTPADTNLNESSHPATNRVTGINLALVEAIETARKYDQQVAFDVLKAEETCMDARARNTLMHRFKSNGQRTNTRIKRADQEHEIRTQLCTLDNTLQTAEKEKKAAIEKVKILKAEKKQVSGGKKRKYRTAGTRKPFPAFEPSLSASSKENASSSMLHTSAPDTVCTDLVPPLPPSPVRQSFTPSTIPFEPLHHSYPTQNPPEEDPFLLLLSSSGPTPTPTQLLKRTASTRQVTTLTRLQGRIPRQLDFRDVDDPMNCNGVGREV